jgi:hypothetical protein
MKRKIYLVSMFCFLTVVSSCKRENPTDNNTVSNFIKVNSISKCKNSLAIIAVVELDKEGVEYSYNSVNKILHITHINADFNCNMSKIEPSVKIEDGIIIIEEKEIFDGSPAKCDCVFDIEYSIQNVKSEIYSLRVPGMKDTPVDLVNKPVGSYYEPRNTYPWKTGG